MQYPAVTIAIYTVTQGVTFWYDISFDSQTHLIVISSTVKAQLWNDDILRLVILMFFFRHPGISFRHTKSGRVAHIAMNCLHVHPILPWPVW